MLIRHASDLRTVDFSVLRNPIINNVRLRMICESLIVLYNEKAIGDVSFDARTSDRALIVLTTCAVYRIANYRLDWPFVRLSILSDLPT